ncbi:Bifunctional protein FolD 1, mitochondrial [Morella rubra]|uniref:Bifunctional protein FolD 1, mitochondrial n=1 Tax=Morella rubra TaxID=262757 RepID=A0A6A1VQG7_9ROSI|nr:Bifunctional protein FolD 1, mitochondrial [Morella rubra]
MRGGCNWVGVVWRGRGKKTRYSSYTPPKYPTVLGPNLPDVWIPSTKSQRPQSSASFPNGQAAAVIDGKSIAQDIKVRIAGEIRRTKAAIGKCPGLAVVLVGERRDSRTYINIKLRACEEVGIATQIAKLPENCTETELLDVVSDFNEDPSVHGIIVQLPLPQHLDEEKIMTVVSPEKDVDGFHPLNMGNLAMRGREPLFIPCAPKGCLELLLRFGVEIIGKKSVVIGRSKIVGLPISFLLQRHHATVCTVHPYTKKPEEIISQADIVVSDVGIPNMVRGNWLKPGAVVIDMGTNLVKDPSSRSGFCVTGDVCYKEAIKVVSAITPVPGGVGPVTIAMLLSNTLDSSKRAFGFS